MARFCFLLWVCLGGLCLALADPIPAWPEIPLVKDRLVHTWEIDDGLPHNRVLGIAQGADGYLWLATSYGLVRFDGARFTRFWEKISTTEEWDQVDAVLAARDGALWVGTGRGGVGRWLDDRFEIIVPESPLGQPINAYAVDGAGAIWFGAGGAPRGGRGRLGRVSWFTREDGLSTARREGTRTKVVATREGRLWFANTDACGWFDGNRFVQVEPEGDPYVHLAASAGGGVWALRGRSLLRYHADGRREVVVWDVGTVSVHNLFEDSSGVLWLGTNNAGLLRYRDGEFARVPVDSAVISLFEDDEGALWAGTLAGGALCLRHRSLHLRTLADGLRDADTYSICEDAEGRLWLAGRNRMLVRGDDATNRSFSPIPGWDSEWPTMTVSRAPEGGMWLGTLGGLVRWRDGKLHRQEFRTALTAMLTDRAGELWMATTGGELFIRRGEGEYAPVAVPEGGPGARPRLIALAEDAEGRIWAGGLDGEVFMRSGGRFEPVALPGVRHGDPVRFIIPDGPETVWIGVHKRGLYRWRAGRVARLPEGAGLPVEDVRTLAPGDFDDLWIGTAEGLFQVSRAALDAVLDGRESTLPTRAYGRADGMPSAEFALGFRGATTRTRDGHLWFATTRGALEIDLRSLVDRPVERSVRIEEVWSGGALIARGGGSAAGPLELPPRAARLRINYSLPQAGTAERLRFRYRLLGGDDEGWVENGNLRVAAFPAPSAGAYRFEVVAGLDDGIWLPAGAGLDFTVRAAWWETTSARAGMILLGIAAVAGVVRGLVLWRVRARIRRLTQSRELERERARIARDMHDELGANLTHIEMIGEFADEEAPEVARERLREVAAIARQTVDSLDEIVWAVNPRYDTLSALVEYLGMFAASFLASVKIRCKIELPEELPSRPLSAGVRYHLFLAVKESLNNAAKHAGAALVRLRVEWDGGRLRVEVADDGSGFDAEGASRAGSNGLLNLRERMAELRGECRIESAPGRGTRVVLELPLSPERAGLDA